MEVIRKGAKVEDVSTAAGVASDLDVVLTSLRNGMNREQLVEYPGQGIARKLRTLGHASRQGVGRTINKNCF